MSQGMQERAVFKGSFSLKVIKTCVLIKKDTLISVLEVLVIRWCLPGER